MTRCENCGIEFTLPENAEITSSKVLCPVCAEERRRLKAQKTSGAAAAPAPRPAAPAVPAAAKPAAPRPVAAAAPAAARPAAARPAAVRPATARPAAARVDHADDEGDEGHHHHLSHGELKRQRQAEMNRIVKIGWLSALGLILIGGVIVLMVKSQHDEAAEVTARYEAELDRIHGEVERLDINVEAQAQKILDLQSEHRKIIKNSRIEASVNTKASQANQSLQKMRRTKDFDDKLDGIKAVAQGSPGIEELAVNWQAVREMRPDADTFGPEKVAQLDEVRRMLEPKYVQTLLQAANAAGATAADGRALAPYGQLEDVLITLRDDAIKANDAEGIKEYGELWKNVYKEINGRVLAMFTPEYQARAPWKDLLADSQDRWTSTDTSSMKFAVAPGNLSLTNEADDLARTGGITYLPAENWRDYVVNFEFKMDSGTMTFYARVDPKQPRMDTKECPGFTIGNSGGGKTVNVNVEYGKVYDATVTVIGNKLTCLLKEQGASEGMMVYDDDIHSQRSRKGYLGIGVQAGTGVTMTKLQTRWLR